jgi:hypothetical protein
MAPSRPAVFGFQWPLVVVTAVVLLASLAAVAWVVFG